MVSEPFRSYPSEYLLGLSGPLLSLSAWGGCVGDPTSTRDEDLSLYISGCRPQPHELVLWVWVRLKVHFLIWYQSHFRAYPSECLCWAYRATRYRAAIGSPIIYSPTHELVVSAWGVCVEDPTSTRDYSLSLYISGCKPQPHEPVLWGWVRLKVHFVINITLSTYLCIILKCLLTIFFIN